MQGWWSPAMFVVRCVFTEVWMVGCSVEEGFTHESASVGICIHTEGQCRCDACVCGIEPDVDVWRLVTINIFPFHRWSPTPVEGHSALHANEITFLEQTGWMRYDRTHWIGCCNSYFTGIIIVIFLAIGTHTSSSIHRSNYSIFMNWNL